jgi:hypothetical protein
MNFLKKITGLFGKEKPKKETYKDVCILLSKLATSAKEKGKKIPDGLSKEDWNNILSQILFSLESKIKNIQPKSPIRKEQLRLKNQEAFSLLEKYIDKL